MDLIPKPTAPEIGQWLITGAAVLGMLYLSLKIFQEMLKIFIGNNRNQHSSSQQIPAHQQEQFASLQSLTALELRVERLRTEVYHEVATAIKPLGDKISHLETKIEVLSIKLDQVIGKGD